MCSVNIGGGISRVNFYCCFFARYEDIFTKDLLYLRQLCVSYARSAMVSWFLYENVVCQKTYTSILYGVGSVARHSTGRGGI